MHRILSALLAAASLACAADTNLPPTSLESYLKADDMDLGKDRTPPKIMKLPGGQVLIAPMVIDPDKREITMPGQIATWERNIEVLIASPRGRAYESLLVAPVRPFYFQLALLTLGLNPGKPVEAVGSDKPAVGDAMEVYVSYLDPKTKKHKRVRVEELLFDEQIKKPMRPHTWAFTGSRIVEGRYMGDVLGDLIVTMHHPDTVVDNAMANGTNDYIYNVNEKVCPKPGTEVTITIRAVGPAKSGKTTPAKSK
ncbi:MAG: hypothetical protein HZA91_15270 [Verrucomicrobia bacterium]|nr:hypothetical protein [Verrucomicrobiota bacterium]